MAESWLGVHSKKLGPPILISATTEVSNFKSGTQLAFGRGSWLGEHPKKFGTPYVFLPPLKAATSNLVHKLGLGLAYQKQRFGPKLAGVWTKGASKKSWDPLPISATIEDSD